MVVNGLAAKVTIAGAEGANDSLVINGQGGDDTINASGLNAGQVKLTINGGLGNDTITGSKGDDLINGGDGNDIARLGAGNDTFVWNPGDDNDTVDGQAGADTLLFNGAVIAEMIDISANGGHARLTRDVANITMDLDNVETIDVQAKGGADLITVNDLSPDRRQRGQDRPGRRRWRGGHDRPQRDQRRRCDRGHQQQRRDHRVGPGRRRDDHRLRGEQ